MALRNELDYFFGAIRFFTRLPVPRWVGHGSVALEHSSRYFPAVGLIIGGLAGLVFALSSCFWPKTLAVLASMAITLYATGAFHEDGWSDMADGFGGGWDREQILAIMKDSRIGSFGAVALTLMLIVKFFILVEIELRWVPLTLIGGHAFSRLCATLVLRTLAYVRAEGKSKPLSSPITLAEIVFALCTALLPLLLLPFWPALAGALLALLATLWLARLMQRHLGGYTGDCLGAVQQLAEVAFYGGVLCAFI